MFLDKDDRQEGRSRSKSLLCMTPTANCESQSQVEGSDFHKQQQQVPSGERRNIKDSGNHNLIDVIGLHFAK